MSRWRSCSEAEPSELGRELLDESDGVGTGRWRGGLSMGALNEVRIPQITDAPLFRNWNLTTKKSADTVRFCLIYLLSSGDFFALSLFYEVCAAALPVLLKEHLPIASAAPRCTASTRLTTSVWSAFLWVHLLTYSLANFQTGKPSLGSAIERAMAGTRPIRCNAEVKHTPRIGALAIPVSLQHPSPNTGTHCASRGGQRS